MARGLSLPQAGLLCVVALGIGVLMGSSLNMDLLGGGPTDALSVSPARTNATVTADGLQPGVAVIAYGTDRSYGNTATGYVNAEGRLELVLDGLAPATEYRYRATHVGLNGSTMGLGTGSFTTVAPTGGQPAGPAENVTASSNADDAENAVDGDNSTGWTPNGSFGGGGSDSGSGGSGSGDTFDIESYLTFSYSEQKDIVGFGILVGSETADDGSMEFVLLVDGEQFGPFTAQSGGSMQYFSVETIGQEFRIGVIDSTEGTAVQEFELQTTAEQE